MKSSEFITEAYVNKEIRQILLDKGYKQLGAGADQVAFLEPGTNLVLKIFGSHGLNNKFLELTKSQQSFKDFADYCNQHPNNQFLPQFSGWETFVYDKKKYLQIRMERLFPLPNEEWGRVLAEMSDRARDTKSNNVKNDYINAYMYPSEPYRLEIFTHLGKEGFNQLWDTMYELGRIAKKGGYYLDLHPGNFMLGSDGHIVISDPFFVS